MTSTRNDSQDPPPPFRVDVINVWSRMLIHVTEEEN